MSMFHQARPSGPPMWPFYVACACFALGTWCALLGYVTSSPDLFGGSVGVATGGFCFIIHELLFGDA